MKCHSISYSIRGKSQKYFFNNFGVIHFYSGVTGMIFVLFFSIFLNNLCICAVTNDKFSSLRGFFPLFESIRQDSLKRIITFDKSLYYIQFVIEYHKAEPEKCLREAFTINDLHFDDLFFKILSSQKAKEYYLARNSKPIFRASTIRLNIKTLVLNIVFEPYSSLKELQEKILLINLLIDFLKRYSDPSYFTRRLRSNSKFELNTIELWQRLMYYLLDNSHQGEIDHNFLISFIPWPNGPKQLVFPRDSEDKFHSFGLIFFWYINYIIRGKDHRLFDFNHPDLVFLIAFILDNIDDLGNSLFPYYDYDRWKLYCKLEEFFVREKDSFLLLENIVNKKKEIYTVAKAKVAIIGSPHCIFRLYDLFEEFFNKDPSGENRNILFQLKCVTHLEIFLYWKKYCNNIFL
jgi:hypothetical protein